MNPNLKFLVQFIINKQLKEIGRFRFCVTFWTVQAVLKNKVSDNKYWLSRLCFNKFLPPPTRGDSTLLHSTVLDFLLEHIVCVCIPSPSPLSVTSCSFLSFLPTHSLPPQGSLLFGSCGFWSSGLSQLLHHPFSPVVPTPPPALEVSPGSAISPFYLAPTKPATAEPFHAKRNAHFSSFFPPHLKPLASTENHLNPPPPLLPPVCVLSAFTCICRSTGQLTCWENRSADHFINSHIWIVYGYIYATVCRWH